MERELRVHPNGREISFSTSQVLGVTQSAVTVRVPETAIGGSIDAELRIYPNLMAHVLDAMEGIGKRPAGCAEQVTSTAYVSLMALDVSCATLNTCTRLQMGLLLAAPSAR